MKRAALLVLLTFSLTSYAQTPAEKEKAKEHYARGVELFSEADYQASLLEFKRAQGLSKSYKVLSNIGQVNVQLNDYAGAIDAFDGYLRDGDGDIPADRKAEVRAQIAKFQTRVAKVTVKSNELGAEVFIDGRSAGKTPLLSAMTVNTGSRKFEAIMKGKPNVVRVIDVVGGDTPTIDLEFEKVEQRIIVQKGPEKVEPASKPFPWLPFVVTGVAAAGAVTTGILALGAKQDFETEQYRLGATADSISSANSKAMMFGIFTDVLIVGAAASATWAVFSTIKYSKEKDEVVSLRVTPSGVWASGKF